MKPARNTDDDLLEQRIVVLRGAIDDDTANVVIAKLLFLADGDARAPICLRIIDSPGGHVSSMLAILDTMSDLGPAVHTEARGRIDGCAVNVLAHGAARHRVVDRNARLKLYPLSGAGDPHEMAKIEHAVVETLARDIGNSAERVLADLRHGTAFDAPAAQAYGLVDRIAALD